MKFPDIDFDAISRMVDMLDDEQKDKIASMADQMMKRNVQEEAQAEEEPDDFLDYLQIPEELAGKLSGSVLADLEAASDLEQYYEDVEDADLSASVLFLSKAVLKLLRENAAPLLSEAEISGFSSPQNLGLNQFVYQMNQAGSEKLVQIFNMDEVEISEIMNSLSQLNLLLMRAEFHTIEKPDLQMAKSLLISHGLLSSLANLREA